MTNNELRAKLKDEKSKRIDAETKAHLLEEALKQKLIIKNVTEQNEQLLSFAQYVYNHFDDSSSKTAKDYLQDFLYLQQNTNTNK